MKLQIESIFTILAIVLLSCSFVKKEVDEEMLAIEVSFNIKTNQSDYNSQIGMGNHAKIVFIGNKKIYNFTIIKLTNKDIEDVDGNLIDRVVTKRDTLNEYYVLETGTKKGILYNFSPTAKRNRIVFDIDTLLKYKGLDNQNMKLNHLDLGIPFKTVNVNKHVKIEKYVYKKTKTDEPDSVFRYYDSSLNNIPFSLSDSLDKKNKSKLYKTLIIHNPKPIIDDGRKSEPQFRQVYWMFEKVIIKSPAEFLKAYELYEQDKVRLKLN